MTYFLIAGEASGDLHAAHLIEQLQHCDSQAQFMGLGGDKMRATGCYLFQDYREMAFMGVAAVLRNLGKVNRNFSLTRKALLEHRPDVVILIDYPSFNLPIAKFVKHRLPDTRIYYYIPPKVWAWKRWRMHQIARLCNKILGIFPFEPAFYQQFGYSCVYVGNPTAEAISAYQREHTPVVQREAIIALLPGSRASEISHCLPTMLAAARRFNSYRLFIAAAPGIDDVFYTPFLQEGETLTRDTYSLLSLAQAAVVNSGTATLETALLNCPQVAVYHVAAGRLVALIRPLLFRTPFFTLVNIIAGREVIRELLAYLFTEELVSQELERLLYDTDYVARMRSGYQYISQQLTQQNASSMAADAITC